MKQELYVTKDQRAFILLINKTHDVQEIIGKVGIRLLLERLDNDDMEAVKLVHDFTGWMLEFKAETAPMSKQLLSGGVFTNEHNRYNGGE